MTRLFVLLAAVVPAALVLTLVTPAIGQAVRTDPNGSYTATGKLTVKGREGFKENVSANLTVDGRKLRFEQTNQRKLKGNLKLNKTVATDDTSVNAKLKGRVKGKGGDGGKINNGKAKIKTNRSGGFNINVSTTGKVSGNGNPTFKIKVKGSSS